jgi:hypothetical protein
VKNDLGPALINFGKIVLPALVGAVKSMAQSIGSIVASFTRGDGSARSFGQTLVAVIVPAARLISAALKIAALNVRILSIAFRILTANVRFLAQIGVTIVTAFVKPILTAFGLIINAAAKAFGWVPGLGGKLKSAAAGFAVFKTRALAALDGFEEIGFRVGTGFANNLAAAIAGNGKVTTAVAQGTGNKVRANAAGLLGADTRRTRGSGDVNVTVNNPVPERASESTPTAIRRATRTAGWPSS